MNKLFLMALCLLSFMGGTYAQTSIADAKNQSQGSTVTITGIVINGSELGPIRYIQDTSAGVAVYPTSGSVSFSPHRGDSVKVTAVVNEYTGLTEFTNITSFTSLATNRPLPTPKLITPSQMDEPLEGQLVKINNVVFNSPGAVINGNNSYTFTSNGQNGVIYVRTGNPLVGRTLPLAPANITGICSQFNTTYQLLPRDSNDIDINATLYFTSNMHQSNITTTGFDLSWSTNDNSSTGIMYGLTPNLELGTDEVAVSTTSHTYSFTGLTPATFYYVKGFAVNGADTAYSNIQVFSTASTSSGTINLYFNHKVDNSIATTTNAIYNNDVEDTIVNYINRAQQSVDVMSYNMTSSKIRNALNSAYSRGVRVRYVSDSTTSNTALSALNAGITVLYGNVGGIMHCKALIIDAASASDAWVYAGSCNFTNQNMFDDYNNLLFIQDQALAKAYTLEFNQMWGDTGMVPNNATKRWGNQKLDVTPHDFMIGGRHVELYFSPSDNTTSHIVSAIASAGHDVEFAVLTFTRNDMSDAMLVDKSHGASVRGMIENINDSGSEYEFLVNNGVDVTSHCLPYDLHHKYCIIDAGDAASDPTVTTGSHNWSTAAETVNDEDELIIHDADIANQFLQEFTKTYDSIMLPAQAPRCTPIDKVIPGPYTLVDLLGYNVDPNCQLLTIYITGNPHLGTISTLTDGAVYYTPNAGAVGTDTIFYNVCDPGNLCTPTYAVLHVNNPNGINELSLVKSISLFPNPANDLLNIGAVASQYAQGTLTVCDFTGRKVMEQPVTLNKGNNLYQISTSNLAKGLYLVTVNADGALVTQRFAKQ